MKRILFFIIFTIGIFSSATAKRNAPLIRPLSCPYEVTEGLKGNTIALWGSHGLYYNEEQDRWMWQRARLWTTVEDLFTTSFTAPYLVPMLENAGALVMQPRAYVRPGYQTIYIRWMNTERPARQKVHLMQGNNTRSFEINTAIGIGMWHYLCTIPKGDFWLIGAEALAIDETTVGPSGYPRFMEGARYWLPYIGVPDSVWITDSTYCDYLNDIVCRGGWVNYLCGDSRVNPKNPGLGIPIDMCLAIHTDAGSTLEDSIIGTMAIYTDHVNDGSFLLPTGDSCSVGRDLADTIVAQLVSDIRRMYCSRWTSRGVYQDDYGEARSPLVPSMIIEMLSHQNYTDMCYALNPEFRRSVARSLYKGIGRYLAAQSKQHFVPQPLAPRALRTTLQGDSVQLTWQAVHDSIEPEATPYYYIVYVRKNGGFWDLGTRVEQPIYTCWTQPDTQYDFCVVAGNAGGISLLSDVASACLMAHDNSPMLIVDAFQTVRGPRMIAMDSLAGGIAPGSRPVPDNYEMAYIGEQFNYNRYEQWKNDDNCGFGMCSTQRQGQILVGNTHDYTAQHGAVLRSLNCSYVSCAMDALSMADSIYSDVDIILGKSDNDVVKRMNTWVTQLHWAEGNKRVLMSGAYIGKPQMACSSGHVKIDCEDYSFHQELNTTHLSAEDVSVITRNDTTDLIRGRYSDTGQPAIISNKNYTIVGFPLECLDEFETIYKRLIQR